MVEGQEGSVATAALLREALCPAAPWTRVAAHTRHDILPPGDSGFHQPR